MRCVEIEIQFDDVDAWLAEQAELPSESMSRNQSTYISLAHVALSRDARNLKLGGGWRNLRIEARA